jgi:septal ring factor EnvC (AmiA/AmiB activator)
MSRESSLCPCCGSTIWCRAEEKKLEEELSERKTSTAGPSTVGVDTDRELGKYLEKRLVEQHLVGRSKHAGVTDHCCLGGQYIYPNCIHCQAKIARPSMPTITDQERVERGRARIPPSREELEGRFKWIEAEIKSLQAWRKNATFCNTYADVASKIAEWDERLCKLETASEQKEPKVRVRFVNDVTKEAEQEYRIRKSEADLESANDRAAANAKLYDDAAARIERQIEKISELEAELKQEKAHAKFASDEHGKADAECEKLRKELRNCKEDRETLRREVKDDYQKLLKTLEHLRNMTKPTRNSREYTEALGFLETMG